MRMTGFARLAVLGLALSIGIGVASSKAAVHSAQRPLKSGGINWLTPQPEPPAPANRMLNAGAANWLNPQPEPPAPRNRLLNAGGTNWLNPQPEPPKPFLKKRF